MSPLQLYEHDPTSLLPLLTRFLPHTQAVLGAIVSCPAPGHQPRGVLDAPPLETMYASFPPSSLPDDGDRDWLVALALPAPSEQVRVWHRREVELNEAEMARVQRLEGSAVSSAALRGAGSLQGDEAGGARAAEMLTAAVRAMRERFPHHFVTGQLNAAWERALRHALGAPSRGLCRVFLAPAQAPGAEGADLDKLGLKLDRTQVGDEGEVRWTRTRRRR